MAYPITDALKTLIFKENRQTVRATLTPVSGSPVAITASDIVQGSFAIDRACSASTTLEVGSCIAAQLEMTLFNDTGKFDNVQFDGAEVFVEIGIVGDDGTTITYFPSGYYTIDEVPKVRKTISITALDRMLFFDKRVDMASFATWAQNKTVQEYVMYCCTQCGVSLATAIGGFPNALYVIPVAPTTQNLTYRQLLMWCCQLMGKNGYIDWEGNLRIAFPEPNIDDGTYAIAGIAIAGLAAVGKVSANAVYDALITEHERFSSDIEDYSCTTTGIYFDVDKETRYLVGTDSYAFDFSDNELIYEPEELLPNLDGLIGIRYVPFSAMTIPLPYLYPMDWIAYQKDGVNYAAILTNVTFRLNSQTALQSVGESPRQKSYARLNGMNEGARLVLKMESEKLSQEILTAKQAAIASASDLITSNLHGHVVFNDADNDGEPDEILIMDDACYNDFYSSNPTYHVGSIWRWNDNGLGYSSTGYNGTYGLAMTMNGAIVADYITTGTLSAERIKAGILRGLEGASYWNMETGELHIEGYATSSDLEDAIETFSGNIETWMGTDAPTLSNYPASSWTTDAIREQHIGDIYYDENGQAYRFMQNQLGDFVWTEISDSAATAALQAAQEALDGVDDVNYKLNTTYMTKTAIQSAIDASAEGIQLSVSEVYQKISDMGAYTTTDELNAALEISAEGILSTVSENYVTQGNFDALTIGGRNILRGTSIITIDTENNDGLWSDGLWKLIGGTSSAVTISDSPIPALTQAIRLIPQNNTLPIAGVAIAGVGVVGGQTGIVQTAYNMQNHIGESMVFSGWFKGTAGDTVNMVAFTSNSESAYESVVLESNNWEHHYFITPLVQYDHSEIAIGQVYFAPATTGTTLMICGLKLEWGNKVTDWSPAPEDIETRVSGAESAIEQNANQIRLRVKETDYNGNTIISKINLDASSATIAAAHINLEGAVTVTAFDNDLQAKLTNGQTQTALQYALSTLNTSAPGTGWVSDLSQLEWEHGKYVWVRTATTGSYLNGSGWTKYSQGYYDKQLTTALENGYSAQQTADANVRSTRTVYYRSSSSTAPSINASTSIGTADDSDNVWTYVLPKPKNGTYFFTAQRYVSGNGTVSFSDVTQLSNLTASSLWCSANDATYIDGGHIYASSITANAIASNAITTAKLNSEAVTAEKIKTGTITATQIAAGTITANEIAANTITGAKIASTTIEATNIKSGAITTDKLAATAVTAEKIASNTITAAQIKSGTITASEIAASTITGAKIASSTIEASNIKADAITTEKLASTAVTTEKLAAEAVTAAKIKASTITANEIASNAITTAKLDASAVTAAKIASGAITTDKLAATAVTAEKIASGAITTDKLAANSVTAAKISVTSLQAISANIGGFTITSNALYNGMTSRDDTTNNGVWLGTNGIALGKGNFKVTNAGALTAISGNIGGLVIDNASHGLYYKSPSNNSTYLYRLRGYATSYAYEYGYMSLGYYEPTVGYGTTIELIGNTGNVKCNLINGSTPITANNISNYALTSLPSTVLTTSNYSSYTYKKSIGTMTSNSSVTAASNPSSPYTSLGYISLPAGTYLVFVNIYFSANANGERWACLASGSSSASPVNALAIASCAAADVDGTYLNFATIVQPTSTTYYYIRGYQNSGSSLTAQARYRYIQLA